MNIKTLIVSLLMLVLVSPVVGAEEKPQEGGAKKSPPPMLVAVDKVVAGNAEPMQELVGTVYFSRVSKVAAEVEGLVASVSVEDGDRVKAGEVLISLQTDILETNINKTRNAYEQAIIDKDQAGKELDRLEVLHADKLIAETTYDSQAARARGSEKQAASLKAELDRLHLQKEKMLIRSPFNGLVLKREVEKGEWVSGGGTVAVVADDREVDIIVDIPERLIPYMVQKKPVTVSVAGKQLEGRLLSLVPKGDIATRTFTVKIRLQNRNGLIEGMSATANLPSGPIQQGLLVPRDAVIKQYGQQLVFVVEDGKAKQIPVRINGYKGMQVAVEGDGLSEGQQVVVKGNERIRDGQPIRF